MAGSLVVDASLVFRLVVPGPSRPRVRALATQWVSEGHTLRAPALWLYEVTSALCKSVHLGALEPAQAREALALVHLLGVESVLPDEAQLALALEWTLRLKRAAAYDSFYLALADSLQCEFWTADERLYNAVHLPWVHCVAEA